MRKSENTKRSFAVGGHELAAPVLPGGLYLVATPIGNRHLACA